MNKLILICLLVVSCTPSDKQRSETLKLEMKLKCLDEAMASTTGVQDITNYQTANGYLSHEDYLTTLSRMRFMYDRDVENCERL